MRRVQLATSVAKAAFLFCFLGILCHGQVSVLTQHNDAARDGLNASETLLTLSSVNTGNFGKLFSLPVDGYVYAQPLYVSNVAIPGNGTHNVVYVATMHDSLYAYDADGLTLQPLWALSLAAVSCPTGWTCSSVPTANEYVTSTDIVPEIGILSTPVIDPATNTLYVVAKTMEILGGTTNYIYRLHALDIATGAERANSPVIIQGQVPGSGSPNSGGFLVFSPHYSLQRPGLALTNNGVYIGFGSAGDDDVWHGWVFGYDETSLAQLAAFSVSPNGGEGRAAIWMSGAGLAVDSAGYLYFSTGNGAFDGATNFGDSLLKLASPSLAISDYFTPWNQQILDDADLDIASGSVTLLPDSAGTAQHPHILIACGKNSAIYVLDRDSMGHFNSVADTQIIQEQLNLVGGTPTTDTSTNYAANCFSTAAYWQGHVYFVGNNDALKMFNFTNGLLSTSAASQSSSNYHYPGAIPAISANGSTNGIVWTIENYTGTKAVLHAYDATNVSSELYNSGQVSSDAAGPSVRFVVPTVANGKVYVGTQTSVAVYGLFSSLPQAAAPTFNPPGGTFSIPVSVTIDEATQGTTVYYTTDGSVPNTSSAVYTGPIVISGTVTLNALAVGAGYRASSITTGNYITGNGNGSSILFVQGNFAAPQTAQTKVTVPYPQAQLAGDVNLVVVGWNDTTATIPVGGVTDSKGNVYTLVVGPTQVSGTGTQAFYYAKNIVAAAAGTNAVTVQFNTAAAYPDVRILEYLGADPNNPVDTGSSASGNSANTSVSVTTQNANELIVAGNYVLTSTTNAGSGFTSRMITVPDSDIVEDGSAQTQGTYTASAPVLPAGGWIMQALALKAVATTTNPPTVSSVTPASGTTAGGTPVTITGTGFLAGATVTFGGSTATNVTVVSSTSITATTPAGLVGPVNVTVICNGQSGTLTNGFTYSNAPTVVSVSPNTGSPSGGTLVTITGTNFAASATVTFGSNAATNVTVVNSTTITATTPAGSVGAVNVTVTSNGQNGTLANGFVYAIGAAISFGQVAAATPQTPTQIVPVSFPGTQTAGDLNIVVVGWDDLIATVQSVSDSAGNHYNLAIGPTKGTGLQQSIYYASNIVGGNNTVTVTFNQAAAYPDIRILEYKGVNTLDVTAGGVGTTSPTSSGSATTTSANELLFGANYIATETQGPGAGFTTRIISVPDSDIAEDEVSTATGSFSATAPLKYAGPWVMQMATFYAQTSGGAPTVSSVSPNVGPLAGGTVVTITGTNFAAPATVTFGSSAATNVVVGSGTSITATTPSGSAGAVNVTVTSNGQSGTLNNGFTYAAAPSVSSVSPSAGPLAGGTAVTITGTNFAAPATVTFGSNFATNVTVLSSTSIAAVTPAGLAGTVSVTVTSNGQNGTLNNAFTYSSGPTVSSVSPNVGPLAGGTAVTITGANFVSPATVMFGGTAATNVTVVSSTSISAVTPPGSAGLVGVTVTANGQNGTLDNGFTYVAAPTVSSVSPIVGSTGGGTAVTITGTNFVAPATVTFAGSAATNVVVVSSTSITANTPSGSAGAVNVTVTSNGQSGTLNNGFTYVVAPTVSSIVPNVGPLAGGTAVTITGTNFVAPATVTIGSNAATSVLVVSSTSITAVTPAGSAGAANVTVTSNGQSGTLTNGFTYAAAPTVSGVSPNVGPLAGGTAVTITGTNFAAPATVTFGSSAATSVVVVSSTSITAVTPAGSAGAVSVTVTANGQSGTLNNGFSYTAGPTVSNVSPNVGPLAGGTAVTITGTGFAAPSTVTFGSSAATKVTVVSSTSITATTPAGPAGAVNVAVTSNGQSGALSNGFTYAAAPSVSSVSPSAGSTAGGTAVTITGANFASPATVTFGTSTATNVVVVSSTSITATTPARAAGVVNVKVTANGQSGTLTNGFTYAAPPTVTSITPSTGSTAGGTAVTIKGTKFASGTTVSFGGTAATNVMIVSSTSITATTPAHAAGAVTVTVTNSNGVSGSLTNGFTYTTGVAISFAQVAAATPQTPTQIVPVTFPGTQTAGDLNIVVVGWDDLIATVQSVSDSAGNHYNLAIGPTRGTGLQQSIYYASNTAGGNNTVTVTFSQAAAYPDIRILEYKGVSTLDVTAGAVGTASPTNSGSATTTSGNELIFGANYIATETAGAGSGFTARIISVPDSDIAEDRVSTATGAFSATAPLKYAGPWVMQMATFK
jgi:hypothetical protein